MAKCELGFGIDKTQGKKKTRKKSRTTFLEFEGATLSDTKSDRGGQNLKNLDESEAKTKKPRNQRRAGKGSKTPVCDPVCVPVFEDLRLEGRRKSRTRATPRRLGDCRKRKQIIQKILPRIVLEDPHV